MTDDEDIAAWGEAWVHEWCAEPGLNDDTRQHREWLAGFWRKATLEWAVSCWFQERQMFGGKSVEEFNTRNAANNDLRLYVREGNGLLIWRAYREYRHAGLPVPENILAKLDQWADRLEKASGQAEVAAAIEMTGPKGGAQGARQLRDVVHRRDIASDVHILVTLPGRKMPVSEAISRVAARRGMQASHVKSIYYAWMRPSKTAERKAGAADLSSVMRSFGR